MSYDDDFAVTRERAINDAWRKGLLPRRVTFARMPRYWMSFGKIN